MSSHTSTKGAIAVPTPLQPPKSTQATTNSMIHIPAQHGAHVSYGSATMSKSTEELCQIAADLERELEANIKTWDPIALTSVLNQLITQNLPLQVVMKYQLGKLVNGIKKKAEKYGNKPIQDASERVKLKWRKLIPPSGGQTPSRSPTPSPSPSPLSSPKENELVLKQPSALPTSQSQSTPKPAPFRLAIQKDPPPKPKAVTNTSFFDKLNRPSSGSSTVRPRFGTQRVPAHYSLNDMLNRINQDKETSVPSPLTSPTNASSSSSLTSPTATSSKKRPFELTASTSSSTTVLEKTISKPRTKRVRFKPDHQLETIREYEKNPEEWNFDQTEPPNVIPVGQARSLDISEGQVLSQAYHPKQQEQPPSEAADSSASDSRLKRINSQLSHRLHLSQKQNKWYRPRAILIPDSCKMPWPKQSSEASVQQEREKVTLAAVYTSLAHVPPTPAEADEPVALNDYTPLIPLQDVNVNAMEPYIQEPQPMVSQLAVNQVSATTPTYGSDTSSSTSTSFSLLSSKPVHLLHPYQPPQQVPPVLKPEQQFAPHFVSQPQTQPAGTMFQTSQSFAPQQFQSFAPQQSQSFAPQQSQSFAPQQSQSFAPQPSQPFAPQQSQPTEDPANSAWSTNLLGALSKLIKNNPSSTLTQLLAQQLRQEQFATVSAPTQPSFSTPSNIPATTPQFSHQYPQALQQQSHMNFRSLPEQPGIDDDDDEADGGDNVDPVVLAQQHHQQQQREQQRLEAIEQFKQHKLEQQRQAKIKRRRAKKAAARIARGGGPGPSDRDDGAPGSSNAFGGGGGSNSGFGLSQNSHRGGTSHRGSFRGQRGRGGGRGPSTRVCRFYDTPTGCVNGENCPFIHVD